MQQCVHEQYIWYEFTFYKFVLLYGVCPWSHVVVDPYFNIHH
jgi:hypothetical protein